MHEYPITLRIIEIAEEQAREHESTHVAEIHLVVGDDSGFIGDSIQMYFDAISDGTLCDGAQLSFERIRPKLKCTACGHLFERKPFSFSCPLCGMDGEPTKIGKEFYIESIVLENKEASS